MGGRKSEGKDGATRERWREGLRSERGGRERVGERRRLGKANGQEVR